MVISAPLEGLLVCLGLLLVVAVLLAGERLRSGLVRLGKVHEELGLAHMQLLRDMNAQQLCVEELGYVLNQIVMDATGKFPAINDDLLIIGAEPTYIAAVGTDYSHYVFSPYRITRTDTGKKLDRRIRRHVISPLTSHSFVIEQLETIYRALVTSQDGRRSRDALPSLPRVSVWHLLVVPPSVPIEF
jgi:hypothetical protein